MFAILRRELSAYFNSPIAYVFLAVFYAFAGFYFASGPIASNNTDLSGVFSSLFIIVLVWLPILTMRLFSEDNRQKTDQALLTAPVSLTGMVLGKFLSAVLVYLLALSSTIVFQLILAAFAPTSWELMLGNFVAMLLLGMALISIGMFISSLTESQVIAAIGGFGAGLGLLIMDSLQNVSQNEMLVGLVRALSFYQRYYQFTMGIFDLSNLLFFLSVCAIFVFLTVRVYDKRRWA